MSDLEEYIISIFKKDRIKFKREVHFKDCAGGKYRYDFEFMYNIQRLQIYESTRALFGGLYSGMCDLSKVDSKEFNFMRDVKVTA